jgi:hypothetical protein
MSQMQLAVELPRTKPTLALESCADFFDRDYLTLMIDVENQVIKFTWDIAAAGVGRREIRIYAPSAWAFCYQKPMPGLTEDQVYKLILPNRDIRSTELARILACSSDHIHHIKDFFVVTRPPRDADGPNSFTVFSRASIEQFLRSRRLS